ncbi:MAG: ABC transporter ATP-binding protein [Pyrinomonadaceae bacterium]
MIDLKFDHVSKRYRVRQEAEVDAAQHPLVRQLQRLRRRTQDFWAVRDVSFAVERGEALGIIGHNGAGKSTVLKLLSNITTPTSGEITINGRLAALIEVGSGFHQELTGRENIYLSGSILGMSRREITEKLDQIVEFAGVKQFIDVPVKRFSSGMYVRLGFAVAAFLQPDILLLDEVLAVGDAAFQEKCLQRIGELRDSGTTIVFISHDLGAVERLCDRVILMQRGEVRAIGAPREVIGEYRNAAPDSQAPPGQQNTASADGQQAARITGISFLNAEGAQAEVFYTGAPLTARVAYAARARVPDAVVEIFFYSQDGHLSCQYTTGLEGVRLDLEPAGGVIEFSSAELGLQPGIYYIDATLKERGAPHDIDWQYHATSLRVDPGDAIVRGGFYAPHEWRLLAHVDDLENAAPPDRLSSQVATQTLKDKRTA